MSKGTITWLPIEDVPKDGTYVLAIEYPDMSMVYMVQNINDGDWYDMHNDYMDNEPEFTHFAYINSPETTK